jgi:hypothetical protein
VNSTKLKEMLGFRLNPPEVSWMVSVAEESPAWFFVELIRRPKCGPQFAESVMREVWGESPSARRSAKITAAWNAGRRQEWDPDDPVDEIVASILKRLA